MKTTTKKYVLELESKSLRLFEDIEDIAYYYELDEKEIEQSIKAKDRDGVLFHINGGFVKVFDKFPTEGLTSKAIFIYRASDNQLLEVLPINGFIFIYINGAYTEHMSKDSLKRLKTTIDINAIGKQEVILGGKLYNIFINPEHTFKGQMENN